MYFACAVAYLARYFNLVHTLLLKSMVDNLSAAMTAAHDHPSRGGVAVDRAPVCPVDDHLEMDVLGLAAERAYYFRHVFGSTRRIEVRGTRSGKCTPAPSPQPRVHPLV